MANKYLHNRLDQLEAKKNPDWNPVLVIDCTLGEWDQAVEKALSDAPEPPRGFGYLVVPKRCTSDDAPEAKFDDSSE
jgi:hypothetical protein